MAAGNGSSRPVLINVSKASSPPWTKQEEKPPTSAPEEGIPFTRPAITTGAHLPWNVNKRSTYSVPRAICSLQTVPPITLLNNRKEATKLVYSKDSENASQFAPPESPFKQKSHFSVCDREERSNEACELGSNPVLASNLDSLDPLQGDRLGSIQASSGVISPQIFNSPDCSRLVSQPNFKGLQASPSHQPSRLPQRASLASPATQVKMEPKVPSWPESGVEIPVVEEDKSLQVPSEHGFLGAEVGMIGNSYAAESVGPANARASSLYKSSGDSSLLKLPEVVPSDELELLDGISRSQSLADKRKSDSIEPLSILRNNDMLDCIQSDDAKENVIEQRAVRRRLTNRASALRTAEKKNLEQTRLEKTHEKLANENSELIAKLKRQSKACNELKHTLHATREKLKAQEDDNCKLKSEMQFLRSNLAMLPQPQASLDAGMPDSPASGQLDWSPDFPFPTPTGMPTQAEIAADLELDRQLLTHSECGHEYLKEWQMW